MTRNRFLAQAINKLHRAYWLITRPETQGVKVLLFNTEQKVLMVRLTYYPNTWTFPGGGVDKGEAPELAAMRELQEETGIEIKDLKLLGTIPFLYEYKKDTVHVFESRIDNPVLNTDPKEIAEAGWFSLDTLPVTGKNAQKILEFYKESRV